MKIVTTNNTEYNLRLEGEYHELNNEIHVTVSEISDEEMMSFAEAIDLTMEGSQVTRVGWQFIDGYVFYDEETEALRFRNNRDLGELKAPLYMAPSCDILATDWVVVDPD